MIKYLLRRLLNWLVMIVIATNLTFFLAWIYMKPRALLEARADVGGKPLDPDAINRILDRYNLNDHTPILQRWSTWAGNIIKHWNWGSSWEGEAVAHQVSYRVWVSANLVLGATVITTILGIAIGVYTASRQYKLADRIFQGLGIITMNIPTPVAALLVVTLAIIINEQSGRFIFFVTGASDPSVTGFFPMIRDRLQHLILPTVSMVFVGTAGTHFMQRALLLDNISADYVRTARAKGLTKAQAVRKHALRTSIIPVATSIAFSIPGMFTGALLSEKIYAWNGMGSYFVDSISKYNVYGAVAVSAFGACMTAIGAILADLAVVWLDPRVRVN